MYGFLITLAVFVQTIVPQEILPSTAKLFYIYDPRWRPIELDSNKIYIFSSPYATRFTKGITSLEDFEEILKIHPQIKRIKHWSANLGYDQLTEKDLFKTTTMYKRVRAIKCYNTKTSIICWTSPLVFIAGAVILGKVMGEPLEERNKWVIAGWGTIGLGVSIGFYGLSRINYNVLPLYLAVEAADRYNKGEGVDEHEQ